MLAGDPIPGISHCVFHALPGSARARFPRELLPSRPKVGLHLCPLAAQVMLAGLEPILVCRAEVLIAAAGGIWPRAEVAAPPIVLVVPGFVLWHDSSLG